MNVKDRKQITDILRYVGGLSSEKSIEVMRALVEAGVSFEKKVSALSQSSNVKDPNTQYRMVYQQSVSGYCLGKDPEIVGTLPEIIKGLKQAQDTYFERVDMAYGKYGDHRNFCPRFANGYPSDEPSDAIRTSIIKLESLVNGKTIEIPYQDNRFKLLRKVAAEDVIALAELEEIADLAQESIPPRR